MSVPPDTATNILAQLGFNLLTRDRQSVTITVPPFRANDVYRPIDLSEEIIRIHGYDRIPSTLPEGAFAGVEVPPSRRLRLEVSQSLQGSGLTEVMTFPAARPGQQAHRCS